MTTTAEKYQIRLRFDRIGRDHYPPTLTVSMDEPMGTTRYESLVSAAAYHLVMGKLPGDDGSHRKRVASNDVEVSYDSDANQGYISCGFHSGGSFIVEQTPDA